MGHLHKKIKKGRPYYYYREIARVGGKPKVINQVYLGTPERILQLVTDTKAQCEKLSVKEFGSLWVISRIDREIDLVSLVDSVIPQKGGKKGLSVGEYFLYAVFNRMIEPCSKSALASWYRGTAIEEIHPVSLGMLNAQRYWEKLKQVGERELEKIASLVFEKISRVEKSGSECFLFDTTNYYTYMATHTESELAKRGKNKDGKNWLRQVGVAVLVSRDNRLPFFYKAYEGNRHDAKVFKRFIKEIFSVIERFGKKDGEITLVFDKGMNSEENIAIIDAHPKLHFITSYSSHYMESLIRVKLSFFKPVNTPKNALPLEKGKEDDLLLAWRTTGEFWGRERTVVVTYNPRTAAKQRYHFDKDLLTLHQALCNLRGKVKTQKSYWTRQERIEKHFYALCEQLHVPEDLYEFSVERKNGRWTLVFRKNYYRIGRYMERFGKTIIVTDHKDWTTDQIVRASIDRYIVENAFRQSKDDDLISVRPFGHWTDRMIRCHIFTCIVALAYLRILEIRLHRAGIGISAMTAIKEMRRLHSCLVWNAGSSKPQRVIEEPSPLQAQILKTFGYRIVRGVLQKL